MENASEHPIARAIVDGARERDVKPGEVSEFRSTGARGVSGKVGDAEPPKKKTRTKKK